MNKALLVKVGWGLMKDNKDWGFIMKDKYVHSGEDG